MEQECSPLRNSYLHPLLVSESSGGPNIWTLLSVPSWSTHHPVIITALNLWLSDHPHCVIQWQNQGAICKARMPNALHYCSQAPRMQSITTSEMVFHLYFVINRIDRTLCCMFMILWPLLLPCQYSLSIFHILITLYSILFCFS